MSILIVDDSPVNLRVLEAMLRSAHLGPAVTAADARAAYEILGVDGECAARPDIDVVLLDVMMPEIDGYEACQRIKRCPHLTDLPVIMVTALSETEHLQAAFDAGASDYVTKPLNRVELLARLGSALRLKQEMDRRRERERQLIELQGELEAANMRLRLLSNRDALTGIANRRCFDEALDLETRRANRATRNLQTGRALSLILLDIDHFKAYNDTYGHPAGDECLRRVANALQGCVHRSGDVVARYGGEKFAALLPDTDAAGAAALAERMRATIEGLGLAHRASTTGNVVTVSIGHSTITVASPERLVSDADSALYEAKRCGRNRVRPSSAAASIAA